MAYYKAKLKSKGDRASHFKPFLTGKVSDKFLLTWTLLYISDTFLLALPVSWGYQLNEDIIQDLHPN